MSPTRPASSSHITSTLTTTSPITRHPRIRHALPSVHNLIHISTITDSLSTQLRELLVLLFFRQTLEMVIRVSDQALILSSLLIGLHMDAITIRMTQKPLIVRVILPSQNNATITRTRIDHANIPNPVTHIRIHTSRRPASISHHRLRYLPSEHFTRPQRRANRNPLRDLPQRIRSHRIQGHIKRRAIRGIPAKRLRLNPPRRRLI